MQNYAEIYARVSAWNAARYDRVFHLPLLVNLLEEEFNELLTDETAVLKLDGYCDVTYVALGGLWKLGLTDEQLAEAFGTAGVTIDMSGLNELADVNAAIAINLAALKSDMVAKGYRGTAAILAAICLLCHFAAELAYDIDFYAALEIVCDSNDTKVVKKTDPTVKANIDKGNTFVAPEPRLQALLDEAQNVKH